MFESNVDSLNIWRVNVKILKQSKRKKIKKSTLFIDIIKKIRNSYHGTYTIHRELRSPKKINKWHF